jgi:hypothetical protein
VAIAIASGQAVSVTAGITPTQFGNAEANATAAASAYAQGGSEPIAIASSSAGSFAVAVGGRRGYARTYAGPDGQTVTRALNRNAVMSISYSENGAYAVAVTGRRSARAMAGSYGEGTSFTAANVLSAARAAATAFASANAYSAKALATASATASSRNATGVSRATSTLRAIATVGFTTKGVVSHVVIERSDGARVSCSWSSGEHRLSC